MLETHNTGLGLPVILILKQFCQMGLEFVFNVRLVSFFFFFERKCIRHGKICGLWERDSSHDPHWDTPVGGAILTPVPNFHPGVAGDSRTVIELFVGDVGIATYSCYI